MTYAEAVERLKDVVPDHTFCIQSNVWRFNEVHLRHVMRVNFTIAVHVGADVHLFNADDLESAIAQVVVKFSNRMPLEVEEVDDMKIEEVCNG